MKARGQADHPRTATENRFEAVGPAEFRCLTHQSSQSLASVLRGKQLSQNATVIATGQNVPDVLLDLPVRALVDRVGKNELTEQHVHRALADPFVCVQTDPLGEQKVQVEDVGLEPVFLKVGLELAYAQSGARDRLKWRNHEQNTAAGTFRPCRIRY